MQTSSGNTAPNREQQGEVFPLVSSVSTLSRPKDIRSLFVSALERIAGTKGIARIQSVRAGVGARTIAFSLGCSPASFRVLPGTREFSNETALGWAHPIAVPRVAGDRNGSASIYARIYGRYRHPSLACWGREILPLQLHEQLARPGPGIRFGQGGKKHQKVAQNVPNHKILVQKSQFSNIVRPKMQWPPKLNGIKWQ